MRDISSWSRRDVLRIAGAAAAGAAITHSAYPATPFSMPGLYPGRVIAVEHSASSVKWAYQAAPIQAMIRSGMMALTASSSFITAWRKLFRAGDKVAIKVNPNGTNLLISSQPCLLEIVNGLLLAGVAPKDIVVCERYSEILARVTGWLPSWVRTAYGSVGSYLADQTSISGYDPNHYVELPQFLLPWQSPEIPEHTRSYAASYVAGAATKIISLSVLKDHNAGGVSLGLKNLSIGCCNNANRAHPGSVNYLKDFIPAIVSMPVIRNKTVLSIIDGVHGLAEGGPMGWSAANRWEHKIMYFATDVVAADRIGWLAVDAEREKRGLPPEQQATTLSGGVLIPRQPQHIEIAGQLGLGEWRDSNIDLRRIKLA